MGNKLTRSSNDSKFTKPTGLYPTCEWDEKTVKKLINKKKIAPRYPGREDGGPDLDECPICFLVSRQHFPQALLFLVPFAVSAHVLMNPLCSGILAG